MIKAFCMDDDVLVQMWEYVWYMIKDVAIIPSIQFISRLPHFMSTKQMFALRIIISCNSLEICIYNLISHFCNAWENGKMCYFNSLLLLQTYLLVEQWTWSGLVRIYKVTQPELIHLSTRIALKWFSAKCNFNLENI